MREYHEEMRIYWQKCYSAILGFISFRYSAKIHCRNLWSWVKVCWNGTTSYPYHYHTGYLGYQEVAVLIRWKRISVSSCTYSPRLFKFPRIWYFTLISFCFFKQCQLHGRKHISWLVLLWRRRSSQILSSSDSSLKKNLHTVVLDEFTPEDK